MNPMGWCSFHSIPHPVHILSQSKPAHNLTYSNTSTHWNRRFARGLFPAHVETINFECILLVRLTHKHCISPIIDTVPEVISRVTFEQEYNFCYWWWNIHLNNKNQKLGRNGFHPFWKGIQQYPLELLKAFLQLSWKAAHQKM